MKASARPARAPYKRASQRSTKHAPKHNRNLPLQPSMKRGRNTFPPTPPEDKGSRNSPTQDYHSPVLDTDEERKLKRPRQQETPIASQSQQAATRTEPTRERWRQRYRRQRAREGARQEPIEISTSEDEGASRGRSTTDTRRTPMQPEEPAEGSSDEPLIRTRGKRKPDPRDQRSSDEGESRSTKRARRTPGRPSIDETPAEQHGRLLQAWRKRPKKCHAMTPEEYREHERAEWRRKNQRKRERRLTTEEIIGETEPAQTRTAATPRRTRDTPKVELTAEVRKAIERAVRREIKRPQEPAARPKDEEREKDTEEPTEAPTQGPAKRPRGRPKVYAGMSKKEVRNAAYRRRRQAWLDHRQTQCNDRRVCYFMNETKIPTHQTAPVIVIKSESESDPTPDVPQMYALPKRSCGRPARLVPVTWPRNQPAGRWPYLERFYPKVDAPNGHKPRPPELSLEDEWKAMTQFEDARLQPTVEVTSRFFDTSRAPTATTAERPRPTMDETRIASVRDAFVQSRQSKGSWDREKETNPPEAKPSTQGQQDPRESPELGSGLIPENPSDTWSDSWFAEDNAESYDADSEDDNRRSSGKEIQQKGNTPETEPNTAPARELNAETGALVLHRHRGEPTTVTRTTSSRRHKSSKNKQTQRTREPPLQAYIAGMEAEVHLLEEDLVQLRNMYERHRSRLLQAPTRDWEALEELEYAYTHRTIKTRKVQRGIQADIRHWRSILNDEQRDPTE